LAGSLPLWHSVLSAMDEGLAEQREEELVQQACTYLRKRSYPDGCTEIRKRVVRKKAAEFEVKDGELYYKHKQKGKVTHWCSSLHDGVIHS